MRQAHHWAADIFLGSIAVHMARVFFTGAFRKPREFNWIVGVTMLILGIVNGFLGYSLPDDLVSGTGIRIAYSIIESIPLVGSYLAFFLFGGNYPGNGVIIPRFFILHVLIVPADPHRAARRPPRAAGQTEAHPVPRQGEDRAQRGRLARCSRPSSPRPPGSCSWSPRSSSCWAASPRSTRSGSSASTSRTRSPTPCSPTGTWAGSTGRCGSCPAGSGSGWGHTIPLEVFLPAVIFPGLIFNILIVWPFIESRHTKDLAYHNLLDRPRDRPKRTAAGAAMLTLLGMTFFASSTDVMANFFQLPLKAVLWFFRIAVVVAPIIAYFVTYKICNEMRAAEGIGKRKRALVVDAVGRPASTPPSSPSPGPATVTRSSRPSRCPTYIDLVPPGAGHR